MSNFHPRLTPALEQFIREQKIFFVASAAPGARVNLSPKGMDSFRVLSPERVAYLDLTGSGNETAAHIRHDGRVTLMMVSFTAKPLILRLYGRGSTHVKGTEGWDALMGGFEPIAGARQIHCIDIESAQTTCGMSIPFYEYQGERRELETWAERKGEAGLQAYRDAHNLRSIDGLEIAGPSRTAENA